MRIAAMFMLVLAAQARAAFEKGGVLDADPRSGALGGATAACTREALAPGANPACLALLPAPALTGGGGIAAAASLAASGIGAGALVEGLGLGAGFSQLVGDSATERTIRAMLGVPVQDLPGTAFGATVKMRQAEFGPAKASGFGLDLGGVAAIPVPWQAVTLSAAAGVEDVIGSLDWSGGLVEPVARQSRVGLAARWAGQLTGLAEARFIRAAGRNEQLLGLGLEETFRVSVVGVALRAGWREGTQRAAGFSGGIGVGYGPVSLDYAVAGAGPAGGTMHLFAGTWAFPGGEAWTSGAPARGRPTNVHEGAAPDVNPVVLTSPYATACIRIHAPHVELVTGWNVLITDVSGAVVWSQEGEGFPPAIVSWTGAALDGTVAPAGEYLCQLTLRGPGTIRHLSPGFRLRLVRPAASTRELKVQDIEGPGGF